MVTKEKVRPYWHVDLKWVFGILSVLFLTISLTLFTLSSLMSERVAIPVATHIVASQFARDGLDDPTDVEKIKHDFLISGQTVFYPFPENKNITLVREDIETLTPREIRLKIFRQFVEPFYYGGIDEATVTLNLTPEQKGQIQNQAGLLGFLNQKTHEQLKRISLISIIPLILSMSGLVFFSYLYGRLISPAVVLLLAGTLPSLFLYLIQHTTPPPGDKGPFSAIPNDLLKVIAQQISPPFYSVFMIGAGLVIVTIMIKLFMKTKKKD